MSYRFVDRRLERLHPDSLAAAAIVAGFALAAVLIGYIVAMGRPVPIALALGAVLGLALLAAIPFVVWTILVGVLLISGPLFMFVPALEKAGWLFSLLGFFLSGAAFLYASIGKLRFKAPAPAFVLVAVAFAVFGVLSLLYSDGPLAEGVRASKRYFQFMGLLFILAVVPFPPTLVRRWWTFLVGLAAVQLPFAAFQRVALVPTLEGRPGVIPIDIVVGTMEGSLFGGGSSAVMALLLIFVLAYLLAALRDGAIAPRNFFVLALLAITPLTLGDVTLILVLMPLALLATYADVIVRHPVRFVLGLLLAAPVAALAGWVYLLLNAEPGQTVATMIEGVIEYNFGDRPYYSHGLNRLTAHTYWFENHGLADPVSLLFGHGLGSSFGGLGEPEPGHMEQLHGRIYLGLTATSSILWDLGLVGTALFMGIFVLAAAEATRLIRIAHPGFDRAFCRSLRAMAVMLAVMPLYSGAPISVPSLQVLSAVTLGLIAWRRRMERGGTAPSDAQRGR
ncbi:hypothetical protein M6I34_14475 [Burkholderiaceae bacterium FT117]|uniref:hypothetical protein n=1 Tax=Zeimonas sediminis TaxID=2944268 RepID=UPI002342CFC5|nr:hypothetical protein [Zeimonas sediminis]MCM5571723.1 hypothetical protein [Zeimonas sediminis]